MDGYFYILVIFLLIFKCSIYFCWYKSRRERYLAAQLHQANTIHTIQRNQCSNVYVQNGQGNMIPASIYGNQGLVERPVAPHYQPSRANQDKPPAYSDIGEQTKGMNNEPAPPSYYYATTYPYTANASGLTSPVTAPYPYPAAAGRPTSPGTTPYPYPANASGPISPGTMPYPYHASGPISPGTAPYPYPASASGPTSRGTTPFSANASGPTPYPYPTNAAANISTNAGAISGPQQM